MKFGLLGKNINYSYSKILHNRIYKLLNLDGIYEIYDCDNLDIFIKYIKENKINGFNVTIPYKKEIIQYLDYIDDNANKLESVNTVIIKDNKLYGYNTDTYGFYKLLDHYDIIPKKNDYIYILGTGATSRTISSILNNFTNNIYFVSRNKIDNNIISYDDLLSKDVTYLINTTPVGDLNHKDELLVDINVIKKAKYVIDLVYNPKRTKLLTIANSMYNGSIMLIYQALRAIELFYNIKINDEDIINKVGDLFE